MARTPLVPGPDHPISVAPTGAQVTVSVDGHQIAASESALTLREASYAPVQYIPIADVDPAVLRASDAHTYCPYKGDASYYDLVVDGAEQADSVWVYREPYAAVSDIVDHVAFYPDRVDITVGG
ncbi:hypothetical protein ASG12_18045 [Williamsia sp. Leaf354]|jgi:uncharacterized protein (DUF427 family)|uniref:DUF427 domain-containing protein n=1 Tax=Williamsia sp. Leaf354 TaxID=1736349 RepID=UPI0006F2381B|nr:DUF427 domain-containing protein [Williamsia sp. Leaf354]KQR96121.1 hypothetical protein ASG12_18045 [Williamsia sp. Leaf354]